MKPELLLERLFHQQELPGTTLRLRVAWRTGSPYTGSFAIRALHSHSLLPVPAQEGHDMHASPHALPQGTAHRRGVAGQGMCSQGEGVLSTAFLQLEPHPGPRGSVHTYWTPGSQRTTRTPT